MKLFCDDIRPAPPGWERAKTVTEAIRKLANSPDKVEVKLYKCIFEYSGHGRYFLVALLPYLQEELKKKRKS